MSDPAGLGHAGACAVRPAAVSPQPRRGQELKTSLVTSRQLPGRQQQKAAGVYFVLATLALATEQRYETKRAVGLQEPVAGVI